MTIVDTAQKLEVSLMELRSAELIACDTEATELDYRKAKLQGIGYGTGEKAFFIPFPSVIPKDTLDTFLIKLFQKTIIFHNAKYDLQVLKFNEFPIPVKIHDTMIMSWLVNENTSHGLKQLARDLLLREPKEWIKLNKTISLFTTAEDILNELAEYCCDDVKNTYDLYTYFYPLLQQEGLLVDYEKIELKFIYVLCAMEMRGVKVDVPFLEERHQEARLELERLEKLIFEKINEKVPNMKVNLRSPKQLENLLFNIFKYKVVEETEKGIRSTNAKSLQEIIRKENLTEDDFLPLLLKFRDLDKVDGTYFIALAEQAGLENTIHCNFLQHGTVTGRLASSEPNLQNIPSRNDEWNVRKAFIPRPGYKFIMADYSQLELRIMAHFSRDEIMVKTFNEGGDIHAETMKAIGSNRHHAKTLNFGLIYGMGPRSLAQDLHIKETEAKEYIDRFFRKYKQVKYFIDKTQTLGLHSGYIEMLLGRRRHFGQVQDKMWFNMIARQVVNSKIQGSASDLVKVAMLKLYPLLKELDSYMLIQIHDEVIVEVPEKHVEEAGTIIKNTMETALTFRVPMIANVTVADRWVKG